MPYPRNPNRRRDCAAHTAALGIAIQALRRHRRLTQTMLGDLAGLHPNYVAALERGEIDPTYFTLRRIVLALGVTMDRLVRRAEEAERAAAAERDQSNSG